MTPDADRDAVTGLSRVLGHELGQIAALFDGYIGYAEERTSDGVACLRRTNARLRNVCESLLELAEIASAEPSRSALDPADVVLAACERLHARPEAADAEIDVKMSPLPAVLADPGQLEHLFTHLLRSPAITSLSGSPVVITGSREGADVRLDIGLDPPLNGHRAPPRDGSLVGQGMDLAVSSQIAERNGGRLWVTSNDRSGRTISLILPAADP